MSKESMIKKKKSKAVIIVTTLYYVFLVGIVLFVILFATPFLSAYVSNSIITSVGCYQGTFDSPARCPDGQSVIASYITNRFGAFSGVLTFFSPILFVPVFWDLLLIWVSIIIILKTILSKLNKVKK